MSKHVNYIDMPADIDEALATLEGLGRLMTAKGWERAAIVAGLVGPAVGLGGDRHSKAFSSRSATERFGIRELMARRIHGLGSQHTIERYRDAWFITAGLPKPALGAKKIALPDIPWPPDETHPRLGNGPRRKAIEQQAKSDGVSSASAIRVTESRKAMQAAIKADPATARAASEALGQAKMEAEDPTFPERHAKAIRDAALETADADAAIERITRRRNLATVELWLKEWGRAGDIEALDLVGLMLDDVRGNIAKQADALTPEMFTEEEDQQ